MLKENTRLAFIQVLEKENLDIDVASLPDNELKTLHNKLQYIRSGSSFPYHVIKGMDFRECLETGSLQFVSFRGTPSVRRMTLKEFLAFEEFVKEHPDMYPFVTRRKF